METVTPISDRRTDRRIVVEVMDDAMASVLRSKSPAQRLASAHAMWRYAHDRVRLSVRHFHPEWDDDQVTAEVTRRMLGSG